MTENPHEALGTLSHVDMLRRKTRNQLQDMWFPLALFGALTLTSIPVFLSYGGPMLAIYWVITGILGGAAVSGYYHRREQQLGLVSPAGPYLLTGSAIVVGCMITGALGGAMGLPALSTFGPGLIVAAGQGVFAWLERSRRLAAISFALGAAAVIVWALQLGDHAGQVVLSATYGTVLVLAGLVYRSASSAR